MQNRFLNLLQFCDSFARLFQFFQRVIGMGFYHFLYVFLAQLFPIILEEAFLIQFFGVEVVVGIVVTHDMYKE
jgi:hypothetical protein